MTLTAASEEPDRVLLPYPHRQAGHCGSGALRDLMEWADLGWGEPPGEGLAFGLGGGLGFTYLRLPGLVPPVYLVGRSSDLEVDLLQRIGATVDVRTTDDPVAGWEWVRGELQQGRPVLVWADIAELPYLNVRLQMSRHDIVVIGYDDAREVAFVVDNDRVDVQEVPYDALARARASQSFPVPTRHTTYFVAWPRQLPDLREVAAAALSASVTHLQQGEVSIVDSALDLPDDAMVAGGLEGVTQFARDVEEWPDRFDEPELDAALRALRPFVEKAGTGGGLFRRLQSQFCVDVARLVGSPETAHAAESLLESADAWSALASAGRAEGTLIQRWRKACAVARTLPAMETASAHNMAAAARALAGSEAP